MRSFAVGLVTFLIIGLAGFLAFRAINRFVVGKLVASPTPVASVLPSMTPRPLGGSTASPMPSSSPTPSEHVVVDAGFAGFSFFELLSLTLGVAIVATVVYKLSYNWYIIG